MAFDPIQEDCLRLVLESMRQEHIYPLDNPIYVERCMRSYRKDPASLIHTDVDRSFHLTAKAAEVLDYRLPFLSDENEADRQAELADNYLQEALELNEANWDAKRMLAALDAESNDAYVDYLLENRDAVKADLDAAVADASDPYSEEYASDLARRPYLRWLAAIASRALIAGRYKLSYQVAEESLAFEPQDPSDVRHTAMLALAKLEATSDELATFHARHEAAYRSPAAHARRRHRKNERDAWWLIADMNASYRALDFDGANAVLGEILRTYPKAAEPLYYQAEFPDGLYARLNVEPKSEDELIIALSEATPLLQEGYGAPDNASFSLWIADNEQVQRELDKQSPRFESFSNARRSGGDN